MGEIAENCPGVRLVLVALKCDLREQQADDEDPNTHEPKKPMIDYKQGLAVAEKIKALRYLGMLNSKAMELRRAGTGKQQCMLEKGLRQLKAERR